MAGKHIAIVMRDTIVINMFHRITVGLSGEISSSLSIASLSSNIVIIKTKLMSIPNGVDTKPIEVARLRSLSPNQFDASFEQGFLRKA